MKKLFVLITLLSFKLGFCQLYEGFEGTFPPAGWIVADYGSGSLSWQLNPQTFDPINGSQSAFINRQNIGSGNSSEDWLISPLVDIGANFQVHTKLSTSISGDQGTHFQIRISTTSQTDLQSFVTVGSLTESEATIEANVAQSSFTMIDQYAGQSVYIAFVRVFTQTGSTGTGDRWLLDDVTISEFTGIIGTVVFGIDDGCNGPPIQNIRINANGFSLMGTVTDNLGYYALHGSGPNVVVSPVLENPSYFTAIPPYFTFDFTTDPGDTTANFCFTPNGTHNDLSVVLVPLQTAVPGFDGTYRLIYKNQGTAPQSGTINLQFEDEVIDLVSATPAPNATVLNNLTWQFSNLQPFESRSIAFTLNVNSSTETPAVNLGDELDFSAAISSTASDETPENNIMDIVQVAAAAYDPNDKIVLEGSQITPAQVDGFLHYVIRFQNVGTAPAQNVTIRDLIADNLNLSTLQVVASSHPFRTVISNRLAEFYYDDIMLPPQQDDETSSQGFIVFKIEPQSTVGLGEQLRNKANIYFDYNLPVVTNTVITTVTNPLSVDNWDRNSFVITPNPVRSHFQINMHNVEVVNRISVINMLGQVVKDIALTDSAELLEIDISELNTGTYFVQVFSESGKSVQKLVKQ